MGTPFWMWATFATVVFVLLVIDLGVLHRRDRPIEVKESLWMSFFYIVISCCFGGWVWQVLGPERGTEFFTGYIVEKTLSLDNVFIMSVIFGYFKIPRQYQHRVLFWGILGVIVLRGLMIGLGTAAVEHFGWVMYVFAAFLIYTGIRMCFPGDDEAPDISGNAVFRFLRSRFRVTDALHGKRFFVRLPGKDGRRLTYMTPLLVTLIVIEFADVVFALDSVPAIFGITTDPYIVFTSNIFAILGLRALYFSLAAIVNRFEYLRYALALVLIFIGGKVFAEDMLDIEHVPAWLSLSVTLGLIAGGVLVSLLKPKRPAA